MPGVELYQYWKSSASWRVRWALAIKRVPFEQIAVDLSKNEHLSEPHLSRNPMGRVPVLSIDGRDLAESVAIIEYLEERFPDPRLYPVDPLDRARVRQIVEMVNSGIQPLQGQSARLFHSADQAEQTRWAHHFNLHGLTALERLISQLDAETGTSGPFAFGDRLGAADLFVVPQVGSARQMGIDLSTFPRLLRAEGAALATEHAAGALPKPPDR